mgnify:CR=1 FL=1
MPRRQEDRLDRSRVQNVRAITRNLILLPQKRTRALPRYYAEQPETGIRRSEFENIDTNAPEQPIREKMTYTRTNTGLPVDNRQYLSNVEMIL